jgi:hypothetical protein
MSQGAGTEGVGRWCAGAPNNDGTTVDFTLDSVAARVSVGELRRAVVSDHRLHQSQGVANARICR